MLGIRYKWLLVMCSMGNMAVAHVQHGIIKLWLCGLIFDQPMAGVSKNIFGNLGYNRLHVTARTISLAARHILYITSLNSLYDE